MLSMTDIFDFNSAQLQTTALVEEEIYYDNFLSDFREFVNSSLPSSADALTEMPLSDGNIHRFGHKKNCWYILFNNTGSLAVGEFGSWSDGFESKWTNYKTGGNKELDSQYQAMLENLRVERDKVRTQERLSAKIKAKEDYGRAISDFSSHPYLKTKQIKPLGDIKLLNGKLLIPMIKNNELVSYQTIGSNGEKFFLPGGEKKGAYFFIPSKDDKLSEVVCIVEGYATGVSIAMASGLPVIVAFDAGNLPVVAAGWRREHQESLIIICGDNDTSGRGQDAAKKAADWASSGAGCKIIIPEDEGSDWNDIHVRYGIDALSNFLNDKLKDKASSFRVQLDDWGPEVFMGDPPPRRMLVSETIPMASVTLLAAMGDTGKGMLLLDLALKVGGYNLLATALGKEVTEHGMCVVISAEDDKDELHRRLKNIGIQGDERIRIVPLPNTGGILPLIVSGERNKTPEVSPEYEEIKKQLLKLKPSLIVIDPLASFVMDDINADPAVGAFVTGTFSALAQETGAAVIVAHHMSKTRNNIASPEEARSLVRGSTALVDGVRACYVLWQAPQSEINKICQAIDEKPTRNKVCYGCVVKSNGPADREIKTFVRNNIGLLEVRDVLSQKININRNKNLDLMEAVIAWAADTGHPFTCLKSSGVYENKDRLPAELMSLGKTELHTLVQTLLNEGRVRKYRLKDGAGREQWLDVPNGVFAIGRGEVLSGEAARWEDRNFGKDGNK